MPCAQAGFLGVWPDPLGKASARVHKEHCDDCQARPAACRFTANLPPGVSRTVKRSHRPVGALSTMARGVMAPRAAS